MKVTVKELNAAIELKNSGMELQITSNDGEHLGDLIVNKTRLEWCDGRTRAGNGVQISWPDFVAYANGVKAANAEKATVKKAKEKAKTKAKAKADVKASTPKKLAS